MTDISASHAAALRSMVTFKSQLVALMRKYFAAEAEAAERALRHRLSDADSDVVLAYLDRFIAERASPFSEAPAVLDGVALRTALRNAGFAVSDEVDLAAWAEVVSRSSTEPAPVKGLAGRAARQPRPVPDHYYDGDNWLEGSDDQWTLSPAYDSAPDPGPVFTDDWDSLFATAEATAVDDPLDLAPADALPVSGEGQSGEADDDNLEDLFGLAGHAVDDEGGQSELEDLFSQEPPAGSGQPDDLVELFGDDDGLEEIFTVSPAPERQLPPGPPVPSGGPAATSTGAAVPGSLAARSSSELTSALAVPLRPEAAASRKPKKGGRAVRLRAQRPDVATEPLTPLAGDVASAMLSSVAIARPVFTSDLVAVCGGVDQMAAWEAEMRSLGATAPVRLIAPKNRHRQRGSLVVPHGPLRDSIVAGGWWLDAIDVYAGAKLYELAVLLGRVGSDVVSSSYTAEVATFRLNTPRGLVGLVAVLNANVEPGTGGGDRLATALGGLISERLSLVAVLSCQDDRAGRIKEAVLAHAATHSWSANCPVVFAYSWAWADDAGSSAELLLGA